MPRPCIPKTFRLPYYRIRAANPAEFGHEYGKLLKANIHEMIQTYLGVYTTRYGFTESELRFEAEQHQKTIESHEITQRYATELRSMSESADIPLWKLYLLNSRTEILNRRVSRDFDVNECTLAMNPLVAIAGQTWDFDIDMAEHIILASIEIADHKFISILEPGMLGKLGMNQNGLAVGLSLLQDNFSGVDTYGIPVHILLRLALDSKSTQHAMEQIDSLQNSISSASCVMLMDSSGHGSFSELNAKGPILRQNCGVPEAHTNHYLLKENHFPLSNSSKYRKQVASKIVKDANSVGGFKAMFQDQSEILGPICRNFISDDIGMISGTITGFIADCRAKELHILQGDPVDGMYEMYSLDVLS